MAIRAVADNAGVARTSGAFLDPSGDFSFMYWGQFVSEPGQHYRTFSILGDQNFVNPYVWVGCPVVSSSDFKLEMWNGATLADTLSTVGFIIDTIWYHFAVTYDSTTHVGSLYINGTLFATATLNINAAGPFTAERLGIDTDPTSSIDYAFCYYRSWASKLTATELKAEMISSTTVKAAPFCDTPLTGPNDLNDRSGNGRNWTAVGTLDTVIGPVLDIPVTNIGNDATLAKSMGTLPATFAQETRVGGVDQNIWYSYTAVAGDNIIGIAGIGEGASGYQPLAHVYTGPAFAPVLYPSGAFIAATNVPILVPVTPGNTYYFKFEPVAAPNPAKIVVSGLKFTDTLPAVIGDLGFPDDTQSPFPLTVLDKSSLGIKYFNQSLGDITHVSVLSNGTYAAVRSSDNTKVDIRDGNFNLLATMNDPFGGGSTVGDIATDYASLFYTFKGSGGASNTVKSFNSSGTILNTWTLDQASCVGLCPSRDNTILYYRKIATPTNIIYRYDLVNQVALSDLAAGVTNYIATTPLVLGDGTILVVYTFDDIFPVAPVNADTFIRRYNPDGTIAHTYQLGNVFASTFLALAVDDPNSFWVRYIPRPSSTDNKETVVNLKVSDGSTIKTTTTNYLFVAGSSQQLKRVDPKVRFGPSLNTCFWIIRIPAQAAPIQTLPTLNTQWQLHRFDLKPDKQEHL